MHQKQNGYTERQTRRGKDSTVVGSLAVFLSLSLCCYRNSTAAPSFLTLRTMCFVGVWQGCLNSGQWSYSNLSTASLAWTARELEGMLCLVLVASIVQNTLSVLSGYIINVIFNLP